MKIFKKVLKITGIILASILLFLIVLVLVAKLFENDLASYAVDELESEIEAPMSVGKVSVIPLFSFPRFSAEINNLWIGKPGSNRNDSIFNLQSIKVGLDTWDLIHGKYTIDKLEISGLSFDYFVNSKGESNIDFLIDNLIDTTDVGDDMQPDTSQVMSSLFLIAHKGRLAEIAVRYFDTTTNTAANLYIPEINFRVKTQEDKYEVDAEGSMLVNNCCFEDTRLDLMESGALDFKMSMCDGRLQIEQFEAVTEGAKLKLSGVANIGDTLSAGIQLQLEDMDFSILKKYVPDEYQKYVPGLASGDIAPVQLGLNITYYADDLFLQALNLETEGIDVAMDGAVRLGDTISVDAGLEARELDYQVIKKFVPGQMLEEYGITDLGGRMTLSAVVNGKYADSTLMPGIEAEITVDQLKVVSRDYPEITALNFRGVVKNPELTNLDNTTVDIAELAVFTPNSNVKLSGDLRGLEKMTYNLNASARVQLSEFGQYIPDSLAQDIDGEVDARLQTSGVLPDSITDAFIDEVLNQSSFGLQCKNVSGVFMDSVRVDDLGVDVTYFPISSASKKLDIQNFDLRADDLNLENSSAQLLINGQLSDMSGLETNIKSLRLQQGLNIISGAATIKNPENPVFEMNASIALNLDELMPFVPDSLVSDMTGNVNMFVRSRGKIEFERLEEQIYPILFKNSSFDVACNNVSVSFPDSAMSFQDLSADMRFENDLLTLTQLTLNYNGLPVEVDSTIVKNVYNAVLLNQQEQLYVKTHIGLGDIDYKDFEYLLAMDSDAADSTLAKPDDEQLADTEPQNWTFLIHGSAAVKSFSVDSTELEGYQVNRLHLKDISTLFKLTDSAYIADQFKFKAFEGEANNSFFYRLRADGTQTVSSRHNLNNIDIRMLLKDLDNLGMDSLITSENISGRLSSELNMFLPLDSTMIEKMLISGDIVLEDGGVYDYGPAQEVSKFTRIKELDNIQFKTLRSNIFMFKNKIWVPHTNIVSNALDIAAFGMFDMNYDYDYRLEIHLSDILFGKSKKRNEKQDAEGEEVDEKTLKKSSRKIRYADVDGETKMGLDSKESREQMMNKIRTQEKMLNFIFFPKNIHYSTDVPENI